MEMGQWRLTVVVALVAGLVGGSLSETLFRAATVTAKQMTQPVIVTAHEFRLVDEQGRLRASLGTDPMLLSRLALYDLKGNTRLSLSVNAFHERAGLYLYGVTDTHHMASLHTLKEGESSLTFYSDAVPSATLGNELPACNTGTACYHTLNFWKGPGGAYTGKLIWSAP